MQENAKETLAPIPTVQWLRERLERVNDYIERHEKFFLTVDATWYTQRDWIESILRKFEQ